MSVALITGGSAGLGRALARRWPSDGWTRASPTDATRARLAEHGGPRTWSRVAGDVADADHRAALAPRSTGSAGSTCWSTTPARSARCRCGRCGDLDPRPRASLARPTPAPRSR